MVEVILADTLREALEHRKAHNAIPFAGGTDLMVRNKSWSGTLPAFQNSVIMVGELQELKGICTNNSTLVVGAAETLSDIAANTNVPLILRMAIKQMASPAIRNMGTIGGNICNASPAGDSLPPLYALDATVTLRSSTGTRTMPISRFIKAPGQTDLASDELLTAVNIPIEDYNRVFYRKVGTRKAVALSKLSIACLATISNSSIEKFRIAVGAVAPTVVRCEEAEKMLTGKTIDEASRDFDSIREIYAEHITPIDDQRSTAKYRKRVALGLIEDFCMNHLREAE